MMLKLHKSSSDYLNVISQKHHNQQEREKAKMKQSSICYEKFHKIKKKRVPNNCRNLDNKIVKDSPSDRNSDKLNTLHTSPKQKGESLLTLKQED